MLKIFLDDSQEMMDDGMMEIMETITFHFVSFLFDFWNQIHVLF